MRGASREPGGVAESVVSQESREESVAKGRERVSSANAVKWTSKRRTESQLGLLPWRSLVT